MPRPASYPPSEIRQRYARLLGDYKLAEKLAEIFDVNIKEMYKWESRSKWPPYTVDMLSLLEEVPRHKWPERISKLADC